MTAEAPANFSRTEGRPGLTRRRLIAGLGFAGAGALVLPATGAYAARMIEMGFRLVTLNNDSGLMARAAREQIAAARKAAGEITS